jgi:hypothetical protein
MYSSLFKCLVPPWPPPSGLSSTDLESISGSTPVSLGNRDLPFVHRSVRDPSRNSTGAFTYRTDSSSWWDQSWIQGQGINRVCTTKKWAKHVRRMWKCEFPRMKLWKIEGWEQSSADIFAKSLPPTPPCERDHSPHLYLMVINPLLRSGIPSRQSPSRVYAVKKEVWVREGQGPLFPFFYFES